MHAVSRNYKCRVAHGMPIEEWTVVEGFLQTSLASVREWTFGLVSKIYGKTMSMMIESSAEVGSGPPERPEILDKARVATAE